MLPFMSFSKPQRDQIFHMLFNFVINEYSMQNKQNNLTAKLVVFHIMDNIQMKQPSQDDNKEEAVEAAWTVAKIEITFQTMHDKWLEQFVTILTRA